MSGHEEHPVDDRAGAAPTTLATGRLEAFSDGVIAVAATLLVLDIKTPEGSDALWPFLGHQLPTLAAYVTSFLTILIFWVNHHALFHAVDRADRTTLFLNGVLLLTVTFISYATSVLGHALQTGHNDSAAAILYALTLAAAASCFVALWLHLGRHRELLSPQARPRVRAALRRSVTGPVLYTTAALLALASPPASLALDAGVAVYFVALPAHLRNRPPRRDPQPPA
ncbi:TMEM175 family protein [Kitasatospora paranensis]|uniref:TMEM175 family protein n=1 Tax=Kitasatospora paranensis TaxID=258053 RepID=A0ABW2FRE6_9ACTN